MSSETHPNELTFSPNDLESGMRASYERAKVAIEASNFEYAMNLLPPLLEAAPQFLQARRELRQAAIAHASKPDSRSSGLSLLRLRGRIQSDPLGVIAELEKGVLLEHPLSKPAADLLHEAAREAGLPETATFANFLN